jgi:hypothetical protein
MPCCGTFSQEHELTRALTIDASSCTEPPIQRSDETQRAETKAHRDEHTRNDVDSIWRTMYQIHMFKRTPRSNSRWLHPLGQMKTQLTFFNTIQ